MISDQKKKVTGTSLAVTLQIIPIFFSSSEIVQRNMTRIMNYGEKRALQIKCYKK